MGCRIHGPSCRVVWGYDPEHTDQATPYTIDQLAQRSMGPHRYAYPSYRDYIDGWNLWRALYRDGRPNADERRVLNRHKVDRINEVLRMHGLSPIELP